MNGTAKQWWDDPILNEKSPKQILQDVSQHLNLSQGDVQQVLALYHRILLDKVVTKGRSKYDLFMTVIFAYVRSRVSGKPPITAKQFVHACAKCRYPFSMSKLFRLLKLIKNNTPLPASKKADNLLEDYRRTIKKQFEFDDSTIDLAKNIAEDSHERVRQRDTNGVAAASLYLASLQRKNFISQSRIANFFGVSDVTLRNIQKIIEGRS